MSFRIAATLVGLLFVSQVSAEQAAVHTCCTLAAVSAVIRPMPMMPYR